MIHIYKLLDPETFEIRYIGQTIQSLNLRLSQHCGDMREPKYSTNWIKSLKKMGLKPTIELIISVETQDSADLIEILLIAFYRSVGCRLTNNSLGGKGYAIMSEEQKKRISISRKGWKMSDEQKAKISSFRKGKILSKETRDRMSTAKKGVKRPPRTPEVIEKTAAKLRGRKRTLETRTKISLGLTGKKLSSETCDKIAAARKGKPSGFKGRNHSPESREKNSRSHMGVKMSEETKAKISATRISKSIESKRLR